jgi:membrane fusion protein (multidrug efflux system)
MQLHARSLRGPILGLVLWGSFLPGGCDRRTQQQAAPPMMVPEVMTVSVQPQQAVLTTELPGRTSPYLVAEIRPQVNGLIQKRLFVEGSDVKAGQVLYQIDPAPFQASLNNAQAALGRSQASVPSIRSRVERYKELLTERAVSQQDYDDAASALNQAEADIQYWKATVETAKINLGYTEVKAPISGRIGRSSVTDGAIVTAYQPVPLATIQQLDPIYVDVPQSTAMALKWNRQVQAGGLRRDGADQNKTRLILEDGTAYPLEGTLQFRDVTVDQTTATSILRILFPNPDGVLLPGMFVRAVVKEGVQEQALLIPQQAVARDPRGNPVTLVVGPGDKVEQRALTLDPRTFGDKWFVSSGLTPGERVIVEGMQKVRPGAAVKVASPEAVRPAAQKPADTQESPAQTDAAGAPKSN